jgi:protocatechuate 3,4-dioxygenase beta subunit
MCFPGERRLNLFRYQKKIIFCVFFFTLTANTTLFLQANTYASQATEKTKDIKIEESKGGLLEVLVTEEDTKEPIEGAVVIVNEQKNRTSFSCKTDKDGLGRIKLAAGEYQLAGAYSLTSHAGEGQLFTIEDGKTKRFEVQLKGQPKITGVVRDKEGKPVEGVKLKIMPFNREAISNAEGKYEIVWDPSTWGGEMPVMFLIARDEKNNLADAIEINVASRQLDIKLKDGIIISGSVVNENNKPIAGAAIQVYFRGGNNYSSITDNGNKIGADGRFEIKAIPAEQQYYVYASAEGFGKNRINIDTSEAVKNRLDTGQTQLATANLSVTGIVTDVDDKPVAGASIYASGEGQPERYDIKTDKDGKFIIDKVCAGVLHINASLDNPLGLSYKRGYINTEGGAKDVKIVVSEQGSSSRYVPPRKPASLVGKQLPELKDLGIELTAADSNEKLICVCFFDMQQRPSRYMVSELAKQAETLKGKGVTIAIIQAAKVDANSLNEWLKNRNVTLPVGQITGDEEKMKFNWGVQSLPWLILTDKKHIIKEEGFSASELEEKIKKTVM